jgi:hypothetical protein
MQSLSAFLSRQADQRHDGRIPQETRAFISRVAAAERQMARDLGATETARRSLTAAYEEFQSAYAALCQMERMAADHPADGLIREEVARLRYEALGALDWIEERRLALSVALRQAAVDAAGVAA